MKTPTILISHLISQLYNFSIELHISALVDLATAIGIIFAMIIVSTNPIYNGFMALMVEWVAGVLADQELQK